VKIVPVDVPVKRVIAGNHDGRCERIHAVLAVMDSETDSIETSADVAPVTRSDEPLLAKREILSPNLQVEELRFGPAKLNVSLPDVCAVLIRRSGRDSIRKRDPRILTLHEKIQPLRRPYLQPHANPLKKVHIIGAFLKAVAEESFVMLALFFAAPKRDVSGVDCSAMLLSLSGTLTVYCAQDTRLMFAGFVCAALPFLMRPWTSAVSSAHLYARPRLVLGVSVFLFGLALISMTVTDNRTALTAAFAMITVAAIMRNGIFPFHSWLVTAADEGKPLAFAALVSGQTGAFVIARLALPMFPEAAQVALPLISDIALVGSLFTAFLALGERVPRRILGLLIASQSGFIISGLESRTVEGTTGALLHWVVVAVSTAGITIVLRCIEVRCGDLLRERFAGIGTKAPRLAVFFLIFGLALVGLPGTLGFCTEDLLFHGALESHPFVGIALPVATAISAIQILRLFAWLFLGRSSTRVPAISDALPRERLAFAAITSFLVISGLVPSALVASRVASAEKIVSALTPRAEAHDVTRILNSK
jgi:NADH-quinone oxidoreductase subunit M